MPMNSNNASESPSKLSEYQYSLSPHHIKRDSSSKIPAISINLVENSSDYPRNSNYTPSCYQDSSRRSVSKDQDISSLTYQNYLTSKALNNCNLFSDSRTNRFDSRISEKDKFNKHLTSRIILGGQYSNSVKRIKNSLASNKASIAIYSMNSFPVYHALYSPV